MVEIINRQQGRFFSLEQAQELLPLVYRLTEEASREAKYFMACVEALPNKKSSRALEIQDQINHVIEKWQNKLERLGAKPKGLWLADFDNGDGYFCWKFPEVKILHKHGYQDGFTGRILISSNEESNENCPSPI
ncbi:MAG: DUF2203 domain-containing protein [Bdellovibrionaceae bacterium]|nr:DUF2203 domain-containing protein [Bdellovibrio sp.]